MPPVPSAIGVLAGSGRLNQLIERAEDELKKTPNSRADPSNPCGLLYGRTPERQSEGELGRLAELRPDDTALRLQVANQLARSGQTALALTDYKSAFKSDPLLASRSFSQIENILLQAGRTAELIQLLDEIDLNC